MSDRVCYNCDESGHISRDCPKPYRGGKRGGFGRDGGYSGNRDFACYNCGESGHMARECPNARNQNNSGGRNDIQCYNCQGYGHISRNCPESRNN